MNAAPAPATAPADALARLETLVSTRLAANDPAASYVASLAAKGMPEMAKKLGEEAVETVIAALGESDAALVGEAADLVFHLTVLLNYRGLGWGKIAAELDRRHGMSGLAEKAARDQG